MTQVMQTMIGQLMTPSATNSVESQQVLRRSSYDSGVSTSDDSEAESRRRRRRRRRKRRAERTPSPSSSEPFERTLDSDQEV